MRQISAKEIANRRASTQGVMLHTFNQYFLIYTGTIVNFLLELMRMLHMILGITPAKPEHERMFLLLWGAALVAIVAGAILLAMAIMPHVIH